jgi:hypothetical protein
LVGTGHHAACLKCDVSDEVQPFPIRLTHRDSAQPHDRPRARFVDIGNIPGRNSGFAGPKPFGTFVGVELHNGVTLDFIHAQPDEIIVEHYAFLVSEAEFDKIFARIS